MSDASAVLGFEPEDLDGHTVEELADYLERDRQPADPSIDDSPACQIALGALLRLRSLAGAFLDAEPDGPAGEQAWIGAVLAAIPIDARAGRRFPWPPSDAAITAHTTEGAVRGLVRAIGDDVPGLLVGSVRIGSGVPADLTVDVALVHGIGLVGAVAAFRAALLSALPEHLPFPLGRIDVAVVGLIAAPPAPKGGPS